MCAGFFCDVLRLPNECHGVEVSSFLLVHDEHALLDEWLGFMLRLQLLLSPVAFATFKRHGPGNTFPTWRSCMRRGAARKLRSPFTANCRSGGFAKLQSVQNRAKWLRASQLCNLPDVKGVGLFGSVFGKLLWGVRRTFWLLSVCTFFDTKRACHKYQRHCLEQLACALTIIPVLHKMITCYNDQLCCTAIQQRHKRISASE